MLVLTRKYQEKVHIGDGITITILRTKGKAVRLGIEAPADVPVIRGELSFHGSPSNGEEKVAATAKEAKPKLAARDKVQASTWLTDSLDRQLPAKVTLDRVPRDKAAEILPRMLAGKAPLREMMQRSRA